jgi:hypothetical protein
VGVEDSGDGVGVAGEAAGVRVASSATPPQPASTAGMATGTALRKSVRLVCIVEESFLAIRGREVNAFS